MDTLERNWWAIGLRGLLAVLVGLGAVVRPVASLLVTATLLGAWWIADGTFALVAALRGEERAGSGPLVIEGIAGMALGVVTYFRPTLTTLALVVSVAAWFVVTGALRMVAAARFREQEPHEWVMVTSGAVSILLGALIWLFPGRGGVALVGGFGMLALIEGILQLTLAGRLHALGQRGRPHPA